MGGADAIALAWSANTESNLVGYHVYRDLSASGAFESRITSAPLAALSLLDGSVMEGHPVLLSPDGGERRGDRERDDGARVGATGHDHDLDVRLSRRRRHHGDAEDQLCLRQRYLGQRHGRAADL